LPSGRALIERKFEERQVARATAGRLGERSSWNLRNQRRAARSYRSGAFSAMSARRASASSRLSWPSCRGADSANGRLPRSTARWKSAQVLAILLPRNTCSHRSGGLDSLLKSTQAPTGVGRRTTAFVLAAAVIAAAGLTVGGLLPNAWAHQHGCHGAHS